MQHGLFLTVTIGIYDKGKDKYGDNSPPLKLKESVQIDSSCDVVPCTAKEMNTELDLEECKYSEVQIVADASLSSYSPGEDTDEKVDRQMQRNLQSDEMKMHLGSKGWDYSEIRTATMYFSYDNLLGEDGFGHVYKGQLKNGQLIVVCLSSRP